MQTTNDNTLHILESSRWLPALLAMVYFVSAGLPQAGAQEADAPSESASTVGEALVEQSAEENSLTETPPVDVAPPAASELQAPQPADTSDARELSLPDEIQLTDFLTLPMIGTYGRAAVHVDPIDAALAAGTFSIPSAGDELIVSDDRTVKWRAATTNDQGILATRSIRGGYAVAKFESPATGILLLDASGHAAVYVNGQPYAGDPYALGDFALPVRVSKGSNTLVFHVAQNEFTAKLTKPATEVELVNHRTVLPTISRDVSNGKLWAATTITNSGEQPLADALLIAKLDGGDSVSTPLPWLDGASLKSCAFQFAVPSELKQDVAELSIQIVYGDKILAETRYEMEVVDPAALQVHTFVSSIDRSVQSYVVLPAANAAATRSTQMVASHTGAGDSPGALVALHTDGISPRAFASCYAPKDWAYVIVPGGRGAHPLDWEDWSSRDAIEALADARKRLDIDPNRIYITGHGMGGHGALVLATNRPDQFAAVATSAAWPSLWTYGGGMPSYRNPSPIQRMLLRAASPSDTLSRLTNLYDAGVYLLHGADDELVPVEQSREIVRQLADWHNDFAYYVKPGVGNWWGPETVDAQQMMQFFANRQRTSDVPQRVKLTTSDLGALASSHWVTIAAQEKQFAESQIDLERRENPLTITGTTKNVKRLIIDKSAVPPGQPFVVRIDGSRPEVLRGMPASGQVWLEKRAGRWQRRLSPNKSNKNPQRYGGMKAVFDHDVLLVYGTTGTEQENDWSRAKAHFDAATFAYRANGSIDIVPDTLFDASQTKDRNVVVYGNVDTNRAWASLLSTTPVQVFRNRMTIDTRPQTGDDLGFLMVRPRAGSTTRLVAAVGGTGLHGMRLTNRLRYFWAGVAYPDFLLLGADALTAGDGEILAAGYFANDWDLEDADIAWRDLAL